MVAQYEAGQSAAEIAATLSTPETPVPERSVIAKLASLGVYKKKAYVNKQGSIPIKKEIYIEKIAGLLDVDMDLLSSLEKVNKSVLVMILDRLSEAESLSSRDSTEKQTNE